MRPLLLLLPLAACAAAPGDSGAEDTGTAVTSAGPEVWVVLDWADTGEPALDSGWVVSFSVELLPCQDTVAGLMPTAYAGHGLSEDEALRQLRAPRAESLLDRPQAQFGHLMPAAGAYCELFYLISFTTEVYDNRGLPEGIDMLDEEMSLYLQQGRQVLSASSGYGVKRTIVDADGEAAPLVITADGESALLRLRRDASVIGADLSGHQDATALLAALAESTAVVREH